MKKYNIKYNIGNCKYCVSYHNGVKLHKDNSPFYDIALFKNKQKMNKFISSLIEQGFTMWRNKRMNVHWTVFGEQILELRGKKWILINSYL